MNRGSIIEKNHLFDFGPRWTTVIQWERCFTFQEGMCHSPEPHTVDIIGVLEARVAYFIEVKDYWARSRSSEKERTLADELDLKVRDTVAAMVGAYRWSRRPERHPNHEECAAVYTALVGDSKPRVVLWYEAPVSELILEENQRKRGRVAADATMERLKDLHWLKVRPVSVGRFDKQEAREQILPNVRVTPLESKRRARVEKLGERLAARFPRNVPAEVRWYVEDCLDLAELDDMAKRVETVRDPRDLLRPRK